MDLRKRRIKRRLVRKIEKKYMIKLMEAFGILSTFFFGYAICKTVKEAFHECFNPCSSCPACLEMEVEDYLNGRDCLANDITAIDEEIRLLHERKAKLTTEKETMRVGMNKKILDRVLSVGIVKNKLESKLSKLLNEDIKIGDEEVRSAIDEKLMKVLDKYSDADIEELSGVITSGIAMKLIENPEYNESHEECPMVDAAAEPTVKHV